MDFCFGLLIILALRHPPVNYIPDFSLFSLYRVDFEKKFILSDCTLRRVKEDRGWLYMCVLCGEEGF